MGDRLTVDVCLHMVGNQSKNHFWVPFSQKLLFWYTAKQQQKCASAMQSYKSMFACPRAKAAKENITFLQLSKTRLLHNVSQKSWSKATIQKSSK